MAYSVFHTLSPSRSFPFKFLGLRVGGSMNRAVNWSTVLEKFQGKLSGWKARSLSSGGRLTLCKSVLGGLPTYLLSLYKAPAKVINKLEGIRSKEVIKAFYGHNGGLETPIPANLRGTPWGQVARLNEELQNFCLNIDDILLNSEGQGRRGWVWALEGDLDFSTNSLRAAIDDRYLDS